MNLNQIQLLTSNDLPESSGILGGFQYVVTGAATGVIIYNGGQYGLGDTFVGVHGIDTYCYIFGATIETDTLLKSTIISGTIQPYFETEGDVYDVLSNAKGFPYNTRLKYLPDPQNKGFLATLTGIESNMTYAEIIDLITNNSEVTADVDANGTINNLLYNFTISGALSEVHKILLKPITSICKPFTFFSWINKRGVFEYELFNRRKDCNIISGANTALTDDGEFSYNSESRKSFTVYKNDIPIEKLERYKDLIISCSNDILLWKRGYITGAVAITDNNSIIANTLLFTCAEKHDLKTGDQIKTDATDYDSVTYTIVVIDEYKFYAIGTFTSNYSGNWNLIVTKDMWQRVQCKSLSDSINEYQRVFNVSFEIYEPTIA